MRTILMALATSALLLSSSAFAQDGTAAGVAGGVATGAVVGGPVGAVVGGVAGAIIGTAIDPPPEQVVTYVRGRPATASVVYEGDIVVGQPLPEVVVLEAVPEYDTYQYAVVNDRYVIVDGSTRQVIQVLD